MAAVVYSIIWFQRNRKIWCNEDFRKEAVIRRVQDDVNRRVGIAGLPKGNVNDRHWFMGL